MEKLLKQFHNLTHPRQSFNILHVFFGLYCIKKAQEVAIANYSQSLSNSNISPLISLIQYCFVVTSANNNQTILLIILMFILHCVILGLLGLLIFKESTPPFTQIILQQLFFYYHQILAMPTIYISLLFIYNGNICSSSSLCSSSGYIILIILCVFNFLISLTVELIVLYFGRCEKLIEDTPIYTLDQTIIIRTITLSLQVLILILKVVEKLQVLRFIFAIINNTIFILFNIRKNNYFGYLVIEVIFMIINISINLQLSIYELFLILTLLINLLIQIQSNFIQFYLLNKNQYNILTIQNLELFNQQGEKRPKLILKILQLNHNCLKCKSSYSMPECLLRQISNKQNKRLIHILVYCNYISNYQPLKALIKLILQQTDDIYFSQSYKNLAFELYQRSKQQQKEAFHKNTVRNTNEHQSTLEVKTAFMTSHSANILFPIIVDTIQSKITFWNRLVNGYQNIDQYLLESLKTTQKMLQCRKEIEKRFDLIINKLKQQSKSDILTLRIIQIYHSGIYSNAFQAYQIEKQIEELIKTERYKQDETLDNMQLIQNRFIILKSSLIRKRGELIDLNVKELSMFLNQNEDSIKNIKHCNQLMPNFISSIHEKLMDNYLQRGYSKLMVNGESSFLENVSGYIEQCSLNLFNYFDDKDDFILNMIITKKQSNDEMILFGVDGRILGFTKYFYEDILSNIIKSNLSNQNSKDKNEFQMSVKDFLNKNPLIQYYIPGISTQVQELRQQILSSQNQLLDNLKSFWMIPTNHLECLSNSEQIFSSFKKRSLGGLQNCTSDKQQIYSKYGYQSNSSQFNKLYDNTDISQELKSKISIEGIPLLMLHPEVEQKIQCLIDLSDSQSKMPYTGIHYSLQFKIFNFKKGSYGYFTLTIKDFKGTAIQNGLQTNRTLISPFQTLIPSQEFSIINTKNQKITQQELKSEYLDSQDQVIQEHKLINNKKKISESSVFDSSVKFQLKHSERSNLFDSSRQPLFSKPISYEIEVNDEIDQVELDKKVIQEIKQEQIDEDQEQEEREGQKKAQSYSQSQKKSSNLLKKFKKQQQNNDIDFASNPSRTSTNSTSKDSLLIVQQLYHNTQLITPLKIISIFLFTVCFGVLFCNIINVQLISQNLISQTDQLATVRLPQNINYFYTSEMMQEWFLYLYKNKLITLSPFLLQRNLDILQSMYEYARTTQVELAIVVPIVSSKLNQNTTFQTKFYEQNSLKIKEYSLEEFYTVLYQITEISYRTFIKERIFEFPQILPLGLTRLNLLDMLEFHNLLIQILIENTINVQSQVKSYFQSVMFCEMFSIILLIGIQFKYWLFIDHIIKSILSLVSRLNENQAFDQINRLQLIKEQLDNHIYGNWKLFNFGDVMYGFSEKKAKKALIKSSLDVGQNNSKASSALYSRIKKTYYLNRINVINTIIITIFLAIYLMTGFLLQMSKNDNFQPSLTVTLKFVQFRHNMDSLILLAGLIKTEPLIPNVNLDYLNQTQACELLIQYKDNLSPLINEVAQVILENANAKNTKSRFDTILNYDLCLSTTSEQMPICDLSTITLEYDQKDIIKSIINNGALGYTAALVKFINQEYDYEIQNLKYNFNESNKVTIQQQSFQNFILQYFTDVQDLMRVFLVLFQQDNLAIAQDIISLGTCLFLSYMVLSFVWIYKSQTKIQSLRQVLVLIPPDLILTTNIRSQAKSIHQMLY